MRLTLLQQGEGSANSSAVRIRDNQRRSRARHKEYVEGLQKKLQDHEKRGVEATLEMQQAARNVAVENSRLRILLGYHGVTSEDIDKFLQTFPDQATTEASKAAISQLAASSQSTGGIAPKLPIQPLPRPSSAGPVALQLPVPQTNDTSTRDGIDAIVGIRRGNPNLGTPNTTVSQRTTRIEARQPLLQPRPQGPFPVLPAMSLVPPRRDHNTVDKLSVLAVASAQQDSQSLIQQPSLLDKLQVPSPPQANQSPSTSVSARSSSRLHSVSPRSREASLNPSFETLRMSSSAMPERYGNVDPQLSTTTLEVDNQSDDRGRAMAHPRPLDGKGGR